MRQDGDDPDQHLREEDIISPAAIRKRRGLSRRRFADALQNWEQNRTPMDQSARALMMILAREPDAVLRALSYNHAA